MKLEEKVGQKLMLGVTGTQVTPRMVELFRKTHAGGLILYRPNFASAKAFRKLISGLEEKIRRRLLVAVDHEGGRVIHLTEAVTVFPDNWALGNSGRADFARRQGAIEALELRRLGIDLNLAPTLDVLTEGYSPNIGIRSYGRDPDLVAMMGTERIKAMQAAGVSACAKHFPGQGQSPLDAHLDLPVLFTPKEQLNKIHLKTFRAAIRAGVDTVMSSHPIYPNLDRERMPATFSRKIMRDLLRHELGFKGVTLSDDLQMGALKNVCAIGKSAVRAAEAGHDMLLVCHDKGDDQLEVFRALVEGYREGILDENELERSVQRIQTLKKKRRARFSPGAPRAAQEGLKLSRSIAGLGVRISGRRSLLPLKKNTALCIVFPRLSSLQDLIYLEAPQRDEKKFVARLFKPYGARLQSVEIVDFNPSPEQIRKARQAAKAAGAAVFFCYDAHLHDSARRLLEEIQAAGPKTAVVLLRDPYDEAFVDKKSVCVTAFGFRACQIEAAVRTLFKDNP